MRKLFCLLGDPVAHARSPAIHARAFARLGVDAVYAPCHVPHAKLDAAMAGLEALGVAGFNVTVPHKREVAQRLQALAPTAQRSGSVNCGVRTDAGFVGHDTDGVGLLRALGAHGVQVKGAQAVVLGAGGSGAACVAALTGAGARVTLLNRTLETAQAIAQTHGARAGTLPGEARGIEGDEAAAALGQAALVVHCTTVGMKTSEVLVDPKLLSREACVVDLVYVGAPASPPGDTELLVRSRARGLVVVDGLEVLVHQAAAALELWLARDEGSLNHLLPELRAAALEA